MKKILGLTFAAIAAVLLFGGPHAPRETAHVLNADHSATTLMNAQTAAGPGLASVGTQVTPTEGGSDRHFFQYQPSVSGLIVLIQQSNDSGTTWATVHVFDGGPEMWSAPTCGACIFRAYKQATTTGTVSIYHSLSGASVPLAPTYTATATPTVTPTSTNTPTSTPTYTKTATPAATSTPTIDPLSITPTATPTYTNTPTVTPTATRTPTYTPT